MTATVSDRATEWRGVLVLGASLLAISVLLDLGLSASTNPAPGDFIYEVVEWLQGVLYIVGSVMLAAALVLRQLGR